MKKIYFIAKTELAQTLRQTRILTLLFFLVILYESVLSPINALSAETSMSLHFAEPFILMCTTDTNIILIPIVYLFILSGFPYCKKEYFQMIRTGKRRWFFGELLFIVIISFAVTLIIFLASMLFTAGQIEPQDSWSSFMTRMFQQYPEKYMQDPLLFLNASTIAHGEPINILIYTFGMMWTYLIICGIGLLLGTVTGHRIIAFIVNVAVAVAGGICNTFSQNIKWIFPLAHMEYGEHFNSVFSEVYFPVWGSIAYYLLLIAALIVFCLYRLKRMNVGDEI